MSTISKVYECSVDENICQGDVFRNVKYRYIDYEDNEKVEMIEFTFPLAIIISQACDVLSMGEMIMNSKGKATKFMPSILMTPIYECSMAKNAKHLDEAFEYLKICKDDNEKALFTGKDLDVVRKDWHYRYHSFKAMKGEIVVLDDSIIEFKHYFSVPASYLVENRQNRFFRVDDLFAEQITLKFATYLSRVAIP